MFDRAVTTLVALSVTAALASMVGMGIASRIHAMVAALLH